jgi:hypothetical protein
MGDRKHKLCRLILSLIALVQELPVRALRYLPVPVAVVALVAAVSSAPQATVTVTVNARCAGPKQTEITVSPWNVRMAQGDQINWVIANNANSDNITIEPKDRTRWPFTNQPPYAGTKANPARGTGMRPNARGTYKYNISLICQQGSNAPDTVVVDPDIIVDDV